MGGQAYTTLYGVDPSGLLPTYWQHVPPRLRKKAAALRSLMKAIDDAEAYLEGQLEQLEYEFSELESEVGIEDEHHDPEETDQYVEG